MTYSSQQRSISSQTNIRCRAFVSATMPDESIRNMLDALKRHWPEYLTEACGLAGFVIGAGLLTVLLEHPDSFVQQAMGQQPLLRRIPLGLGMGAYITGGVYSPWGKQSGAHFNPAVTLVFFRLRKIKRWDALFYVLAQFTGAIVAAQLLALLLGELYAHPSIHYVTTIPGRGAHATLYAFAAEFIISFVFMFVMLFVINSKRMERFAGLLAGALIATYLIFEAPYSGMSLNPARSFASALAARHWLDLWIYFAAPSAAMLLAAELFLRFKKNRRTGCAKLHHRNNRRCIFCDDKPLPHYPDETIAA